LCLGCNQKEQRGDSHQVKPTETVASPKQPDKMLDYLLEKYTYVYQFSENVEGETEGQYLGVKLTEDNCVEYYLLTETLPCDTEYKGKACRTSEEFIDEHKEYDLGIIISKDQLTAQINYSAKDSLDTDCLPINEVTMYRKP
jgi:uncharacterized Fe-S center protein